MKWKKIKETKQEAEGKNGCFEVQRSCGLWWGRYYSYDGFKAFKCPPRQKLSEAKALCENNVYWEAENA